LSDTVKVQLAASFAKTAAKYKMEYIVKTIRFMQQMFGRRRRAGEEGTEAEVDVAFTTTSDAAQPENLAESVSSDVASNVNEAIAYGSITLVDTSATVGVTAEEEEPKTVLQTEFHPCPSRTCWDYNAVTQTCTMATHCSSLECKFNKMHIQFQSELFGMTDDSPKALFALPLLLKPSWDEQGGQWSLNCVLDTDNCGMEIKTVDDKLQLTVTIEQMSNTIALENAHVMSVQYGQAKFVCLYDTEFKLSSTSFDVSAVSISGQKTGTGTLDEGFGMVLNDGREGTTPLGTMMQVQVNWREPFKPVTFYLKKCSIGHGTSMVEIISGGCLSNTLFVTKLDQSEDNYRFEYQTFYVDGENGDTQSITCIIKLCLDTCDRPTTESMCPTGKPAFQYSVSGYQ